MAKLLFIPVSLAGGLLAGLVASRAFEQIWKLIDKEEPPESEHREISWPKLIAAAAIEGAIFRIVKEAADHGSRHAFASVTGTWPGEEEPEPK